MTENDYILATNLAKLRAAESILRDVLPGCQNSDNFGIPQSELIEITRPLSIATLRLSDICIDAIEEETENE